MTTLENGRPRAGLSKLWTACWSALLSHSALMPGPSAIQARAYPDGVLDAQSIDFSTIDAYVTEQVQAMHIPGAALGIVQANDILHVKGFGMASRVAQLVTSSTPFILGSASKAFTALAMIARVSTSG